MNKSEALLEKALRDNNYSVTYPRRLVFSLLVNQPPQSMHDLIVRANKKIDRVSIYRVIELYEKLGIVNRIAIGWKYKVELSDVFLEHHHHLSCIQCGKIVAIKDSHEIENSIDKLSVHHGFTLTSHQLELQGYCPTCKQSVPKDSSS